MVKYHDNHGPHGINRYQDIYKKKYVRKIFLHYNISNYENLNGYARTLENNNMECTILQTFILRSWMFWYSN